MRQSLKFLATIGLISVLQIPLVFGFRIIPDRTYQVFIERDGQKICGGTAISKYEIVTAASCLYSDSISWIQVKSFNSGEQPIGKPHKVQDKCMAPNYVYNSKDHANDLVVLRLRDPINPTDPNSIFSPISLVEKDFTLKDGDLIEVTGYGLDEDRRPSLIEAIVEKTPLKDCQGHYNDVRGPTVDQFCAHKRKSTDEYDGPFDGDFGACDGDGGVSATAGGKLVGLIANWRPNCTTNPGLPVIFTSIAHHRDFIDGCLKMFADRKEKYLYNPPPGVSVDEWLANGLKEDTWLDKLKRIFG
ncbi:hypothetical protein QAD02_019087 [Eretmocerus hayati]|uniref:Uncharacterized protein n=1 Tax=Eretmocerus hayati TaxID=131215 RepID=A0ACC2PNE7_9HYME|nr:hypothetical protein QAD02_019087 [Eretmocerus hayati]